ncbi:MAG: arsenite methyltransferase [Candidatus Promineifilaceae bacterium]
MKSEAVHEAVLARYGRIATEFEVQTEAACCDDGQCCSGDLYEADITWLPDDVTGLSLGCGDPIALAQIAEGQTMLDLGSGGGIDCFMAARAVGPTGHVIGVDMTPAMLDKANRNKEKLGMENVEFRLGKIESLPVADNTIDWVISNCVINLSPDKTAVFHEAYRVLKPGGRLAVSDMMTQGHFSEEERANMAAWAECITGAEDVADYVAAMRAAGFKEISVRDKSAPEVELVDTIPVSNDPRLFSARITAVK